MIKKETYTSPEVDVFTLRPEGVICQSTTTTGDTSIPDWGNGEDFPISF